VPDISVLRKGLTAVALVSSLSFLTGCGAAAHRTVASRTALVADHEAIHGAGMRARATILARSLSAKVGTPGRARRLSPRAIVPDSLKAMLPSPMADVVDLRSVYQTNWPAGRVNDYLVAHIPSGLLHGDAGEVTRSGGAVSYSVNYVPRSQPSWAYEATVATTAVPRPGGSLVLIEAQVAWYPSRSAAEHVDAAGYQSVTLTAPSSQTGASRPVTRTFAGRAVVVRLAAIVNSMHADPHIVVDCGAMSAGSSYRLVFTPAASRWPRIEVSTQGCAVDMVTVGHRVQPALFDKGSGLVDALRDVLGLTGR